MTSYIKVFAAWESQWWADKSFDINSYIVPVDTGLNEDKWKVIKQVNKDFPVL
jgi:hypothetical protein